MYASRASSRSIAAAVGVALACETLVASPVRAQEPPPPLESPPSPQRETGFSFGLRTGFAWPAGSTRQASNTFAPPNFAGGRGGGQPPTTAPTDFSDTYVGMIPIWADIGYRVRKNLYVGAYFQLGPAFPAGATCPADAHCSGLDYRFGVNGHWHMRPGRPVDPWLGVGLGYEITTFHGKQGDLTLAQSVRGFELFNLQLGLDLAPARSLRVGPFASLSFAQYTYATSKSQNPGAGIDDSTDGDIARPAPHLWFMLGVRTQYDL